MKTETICAIATAPGIGGIGIVRISGEDAFNIINKIFKPKNVGAGLESARQMKYGHIIDTNTNEIIDEVLVSFFRTPKSYTTEDMCEINSHGGRLVMNKIVEICLENGAVMAKPRRIYKKSISKSEE